MNNLSFNKRIGIRKITADIDSRTGYLFNNGAGYYVRQDNMNYISNMPVNTNQTTQKIIDL
jgi:hypothetical protein